MLMNAFEPGDQRRVLWLDSVGTWPYVYYYPYKYKAGMMAGVTTEYQMVIRLGELYLIRAEARARQGNIAGALGDLNVIRTRAGLSAYNGSTDQASVLTAIVHEGQMECFTEWGARWLELKRTGLDDQVMTMTDPIKGGVWNMVWALWPLPVSALQSDVRLMQNAGY
jgi:hypothetical protein